MENIDKLKNRSIKMTDKQFYTLKKGACERNLPLGKYIETISNDFNVNCFEPNPNFISRLLTIKALLEIPIESWNEKMRELYSKNVEEICVLLKW